MLVPLPSLPELLCCAYREVSLTGQPKDFFAGSPFGIFIIDTLTQYAVENVRLCHSLEKRQVLLHSKSVIEKLTDCLDTNPAALIRSVEESTEVFSVAGEPGSPAFQAFENYSAYMLPSGLRLRSFGIRRLNLANDAPPDIALEIDITNESLSKW